MTTATFDLADLGLSQWRYSTAVLAISSSALPIIYDGKLVIEDKRYEVVDGVFTASLIPNEVYKATFFGSNKTIRYFKATGSGVCNAVDLML